MTTDPVSDVIRTTDRFVRAVDPAVLIVTASDGVERSGCLVGFATQVSIDPWRFMVCISKDNFTHKVADRAKQLAVHLAAAVDRPVASLFGQWSTDEIDKFARVDWLAEPSGAVVLTGIAAFVGRVVERVDLGDHVGYVLEPTATYGPELDDRTPLRLSDITDFVAGHPRG